MSVTVALDNAYEAFSRVRRPRTIDGCPCCIERKDIPRLVKTPLRELSPANLASYAESVFLTVGDVDDFRYFLPRLLDIGVHVDGWWPSPEVLLGKLKLAEWLSWSAAEQAAVRGVLRAWFERILSQSAAEDPPNDMAPKSLWDGDAFICGVGRSGEPLDPYLERLLEPAHQLHLQSVYLENFDGKAGVMRAVNPFWDDAPEAAARFVAFFERPDVERLARAAWT